MNPVQRALAQNRSHQLWFHQQKWAANAQKTPEEPEEVKEEHRDSTQEYWPEKTVSER